MPSKNHSNCQYLTVVKKFLVCQQMMEWWWRLLWWSVQSTECTCNLWWL